MAKVAKEICVFARNIPASTATAIQDYFESVNITLMGGVPTGWRDLTRDSEPDPAWAAVYRRFAVISPWTVGRYTSVGGLSTVDNFLHKYIVPDKAAADAAGADYLPVVFPGCGKRLFLRHFQTQMIN
jgi:hypothetical protein